MPKNKTILIIKKFAFISIKMLVLLHIILLEEVLIMKTISVWSPCGGSGKTTVSLLVAGALKARGFNVVLFDIANNLDALDIGSRNKLGFPVYSGEDESTIEAVKNSSVDFTIVDYDIDVSISDDSDLVIIPVRPSVLHMKKLNSSSEEFSHLNCLPVFNLTDTSREEHKKIYSSKGDWPVLKNRSLYERMVAACTTVFSQEAESWAAVQPTRNEVDLLVDLVLYKLENKLPANKERMQKVMNKLGSSSI